jgi:aminoglycoside 2'-N-acetyltransferase I
MPTTPPGLTVVPGDALTPAERDAIVALCERAFREPITGYLALLPAPVHVLAHAGGTLVSHACWVTRCLQAGDGPLLRTAYVELVATEPGQERRGYAGAVMRRLAAEIAGYDLGGLTTGVPAFYARLGWESWRGPFFVRLPPEQGGGLLPTPDEPVMVLRLPRTPAWLDLDAPLSAEWREGELW